MELINRKTLIDEINGKIKEPAYQHDGEDWYVGMESAEDIVTEQPIISEIYVVVVSTDQHTSAVAYDVNYNDAYLKAWNWLEQKATDPNIGLRIDGVFDKDIGVCNFTTKDLYFGMDGFIIIDCVKTDAFKNGKMCRKENTHEEK